jgi:2-oxoglutarate dehydrogenase E1 component
LQAKLKTIEEGKGLDWATAEALAYGSLLLEGTHVRITGQDVQSGTFAHRHSVARDQNTMAEYCFLNNLNLGPQQQYVARNSILAEYAVLGFELGYSYENPNALCIWEAQFGDFANTAQVMIDQFICAGESKWYQQSGLVLLLPHGYEGQGAEHSSARIERFLQLSDDDEDDIPHFQQDYGMNQIQKENWQVMNLTTPANVFHALRRQVHRNFRKPMIVASTKSLFRHKECVSDLADLGPDSRFQRLIGERNPEIAANPDKVDRLIFCTGKIYYELAAKRDADGLKNVAIVSLEQIAPFPFDRVLEQLKMYKNVPLGDGVIPGNVIFCQEEPKNMGAWFYVKPRLVTTYREGLEKDVVIRYVGRRAAASPATGYPKLHMAEQNGVIEGAIHGDTLAQGKQRPTGLLGHQT